MLISPRIITYPLLPIEVMETSIWKYFDCNGQYGKIVVDYGTDKFNWNPTISYENLKPVTENSLYNVPLFRYDSSRKNMKMLCKWTKRQIASFFDLEYFDRYGISEGTQGHLRPLDLIGYFTIIYSEGKNPIIEYTPWERQVWTGNKS